MSIKDMYTEKKVSNYKSPEVIPESCKECKYFKKTGIIDRYRGHCLFFEEDRFSNWKCIVFDYLRSAEGTEKENEIIEDINQRLLSEKETAVVLKKEKNRLPLGVKFIFAGILLILIQVICVATNFTPLLSVKGVGEPTLGQIAMYDLTGSYNLSLFLATDYSDPGALGYLSMFVGLLLLIIKLIAYPFRRK